MNKTINKYYMMLGLIFLSAFSLSAGNDKDSIQWMSITEAVELQKEHPKKIMVYIYTDWCLYCKFLKKGAYKHEPVISNLNNNFYAVKFNAEQKEAIAFKDTTYTHHPTRRKGGFHDLADALAGNELWGYPTIVMYDEKLNRLNPMTNFLKKDEFSKYLEYFQSDSYKTTIWEEYLNEH